MIFCLHFQQPFVDNKNEVANVVLIYDKVEIKYRKLSS